MSETLEAFRVGELHYRSRDIGYGVEEDCDTGYWNGEMDTWGKFTWVSGIGGPTLYLFTDEVVSWEPFGTSEGGE